MDMMNNIQKTTKEEAHFLNEAATEIANNGSTKKTCPRCGAPIIVEQLSDSACIIRCQSDDCIKTGLRGI